MERFWQRTDRWGLEKDIEEKEKGVGGHTRAGQIFSSGRWLFGQTKPFMSKLKLSVERWLCQECFILEKENPQKPFKEDGIFQSVFYFYF